MSIRPVPDKAVAFIAKHEGLRLKAYPDPASGGEPWTIGYGHTKGVTPDMTITRAQALLFLDDDLQDAAEAIQARIGGVVHELTDNQYAALLSFVFNCGARPTWTIWKRLKARQFDQVPLELMKFVNASGKKMQGLVRRRAEEVKLWSTDEPGSVDEDPPSSVTRFMETPPTPADPAPASRSASIITGALGVTATVPVAAQQVTQAVEPYREASPLVGNIIAIVATIAAVAAVVTLALTWMKKREHRR